MACTSLSLVPCIRRRMRSGQYFIQPVEKNIVGFWRLTFCIKKLVRNPRLSNLGFQSGSAALHGPCCFPSLVALPCHPCRDLILLSSFSITRSLCVIPSDTHSSKSEPSSTSWSRSQSQQRNVHETIQASGRRCVEEQNREDRESLRPCRTRRVVHR